MRLRSQKSEATPKIPGVLRLTLELALARKFHQTLGANLKTRWTAARRVIARGHSPVGLDMSDFDTVLEHWGITSKAELQTVRGGILCDLIVSVVVLIGVAVTLISQGQSQVGLCSGIVLASLIPVIALPKIWRLHVLHTQRFIPFSQWLRGRS
jgi:hypothetical protein